MIDTVSADYVVAPVPGQHTFSNPFGEEASNTIMPAFYINYFKLIQSYLDEGLPMNAATNKKAMPVMPLCLFNRTVGSRVMHSNQTRWEAVGLSSFLLRTR